jgi:alpha-tubulin suppressor-like RCC1 family protein
MKFMKKAAFFAAVASLIAFAACGGDKKNDKSTEVSISIAPLSTTTTVGTPVPFTVTVNNTTNTGFEYSINPTTGLTCSKTDTGLSCTASAPNTYTITVTSADAGKTNQATLIVNPGTNPTPSGVSQISAGQQNTVVITTDSSIWKLDATHTRIGTDTDWATIANSSWGNHVIAIKTDGSLWAWGDNRFGQLGIGVNGIDENDLSANRNTPVRIGTDTNWTAIAAGGRYTIALKENGSLYAWGDNTYGQLGNGTNTSNNAPIQVGTTNDWKAISAGYNLDKIHESH